MVQHFLLFELFSLQHIIWFILSFAREGGGLVHPIRSMLFGVSFFFALSGVTWAASDHAVKLRGKNVLSEYSPPEAFLLGNFVADEVEPGYIFGKVNDFVRSRPCPTTWLIEEGERKRIEGRQHQAGPVEYTLYLEEDCPGKLVYYVFVDRSQASATQWMEWRRQFHKSKTDPQYGAARVSLEQAAQDGFPVDGELRFVEVEGTLLLKKPEEVLIGEHAFPPIYDLKAGMAVAK